MVQFSIQYGERLKKTTKILIGNFSSGIYYNNCVHIRLQGRVHLKVCPG